MEPNFTENVGEQLFNSMTDALSIVDFFVLTNTEAPFGRTVVS